MGIRVHRENRSILEKCAQVTLGESSNSWSSNARRLSFSGLPVTIYFNVLNMRWNRLLAYLIGCVALALSFVIYLTYVHGLGFPDGFITELGHAERRLAFIFIGISIVLGSYSTYLGKVAPRKSIRNKLSAAITLYLISIIVISLIDFYYRSHLTGSGGG